MQSTPSVFLEILYVKFLPQLPSENNYPPVCPGNAKNSRNIISFPKLSLQKHAAQLCCDIFVAQAYWLFPETIQLLHL